MRLDGRQVVVTAAAQGIGRATAEAFAQAGARVWATDINPAKLADLHTMEGISTRLLDVRDAAAIQQFAADTGAVDVCCSTAPAMSTTGQCSTAPNPIWTSPST